MRSLGERNIVSCSFVAAARVIAHVLKGDGIFCGIWGGGSTVNTMFSQ
jgi:hypothetical protein